MYAHDRTAGAKHERAKALVEELWRDRSGVVSTQVLQELTVNVRRRIGRPLDAKATREIVALTLLRCRLSALFALQCDLCAVATGSAAAAEIDLTSACGRTAQFACRR